MSHWGTNKARQWLDLGPIKNTKCVVLQTLWWDEMSIDTFIIRGNSYLQWWMSKLLIKLVQGGFSYQRRWLSVWRALRDTCCGKYNWGFGISFPYCHYDSYCVQNVFIICVFPIKKSKVALEAQNNNPCHDFHILYGLAELFFDMPHFSYALGQFSCFFGDCTWHPQISQLSDYPPFLIRIIVWHHLGTGSSDS